MKYKNQNIPVTRVISGIHGPISPLCNQCTTTDCSHLIVEKDVSVIGVKKKWRCLMKGRDAHIVITCDGFSK